jgi:hypothetical protein
LDEAARLGEEQRSRGPRQPLDEEEARKRLVAKASELIDSSSIRKGVRVLESEIRLAPVNYVSLLRSMRSLHPEAGEAIDEALLSEADVSMEAPLSQGEESAALVADVYAILQRSRDKAAGPDCWSAHHMLQIMEPPDMESEINRDFCRYLAWLSTGCWGAAASTIFTASRLVGIPKAGQQGEFRPIAIGNLWRRLTGALVVRRHREDIAAALGTAQIGFSPCGREAATFAVATTLEKNPDFVLVKGDNRNAFNCVERAAMLRACAELAPALLPYARALYAQPANLLLAGPDEETEVLLSQQGAQQGDPLGGVLFALAIRRVLEDAQADLNQRVPDQAALVIALWDDILIVAPPDAAAATLSRTERWLRDINLELRPEFRSAYQCIWVASTFDRSG